MNSKLVLAEREFVVDLSQGTDISIPYTHELQQVNCFYAPYFEFEPVRMGDFVGSVGQGGPVNFTNVKLNVHGNGTHTECVGHITPEHISVNKILPRYFFHCEVISIYPTKLPNGDLRIEESTLREFLEIPSAEALCIRTLPNEQSKRSRKYSGTNPIYISENAMELIIQSGVQHLLVDFPSVDREEDGGRLAAHRIFWKEGRSENCTITELIYVPDTIKDGEYILNLQLADMMLDAVPSRPVLYKIES